MHTDQRNDKREWYLPWIWKGRGGEEEGNLQGKKDRTEGKGKIDVMQIQRQNSVENNPIGDGQEK